MKTDKIARLLPEIFQATVGTEGLLDGFLAAQERLHEPCEMAIGQFPKHLDPHTAAPPFVYMLAVWMDLDYLLDGPPEAPRFVAGVGRLRELIANASRNGSTRGTEQALLRFLETATGCRGFAVATEGEGMFHFSVLAPTEARSFKNLVERIIEAEKPAFATCDLRFAKASDGDDTK